MTVLTESVYPAPLSLHSQLVIWTAFILEDTLGFWIVSLNCTSHVFCGSSVTTSLLPMSDSKWACRVSVQFSFGLGLLACTLQCCSVSLASSRSPQWEFHWYSLSQSWHSTSSVSARSCLGLWLLLLDNAHLCLHLPLILGIQAWLVTTGGSGWWGHCLGLACPCHCHCSPSFPTQTQPFWYNGIFLL